jgi:peptidoglycan-N-acetylglucosamine deacetylase
MPAAPRVFVTTSWDDDDRTGLKVAELLTRSGVPGTFYIPTGRLGTDSAFSPHDLRTLHSAGFEIGAHTVSHAILPRLTPSKLTHEVRDCKTALEQHLSVEVPMFCYPKGRFNAAVVDEVKNAGYRGARTTQMLTSAGAFPPYAVPTTLQAYPHTRSNYVRNLVRLRAGGVLLKAVPTLILFENWLRLGKSTFDRVLREGGVWHLYGHSWEIERLNLWAKLEEMFDYVAHRADVIYVTNGQLVEAIQSGARDAAVKTHENQSVIH